MAIRKSMDRVTGKGGSPVCVRQIMLAFALFLLLPSASSPARSPSLAPSSAMTACLKTWQNAQGSSSSEVRKLMAKDPEKVLPTLTEAQREAIRAYLILSETLKFRCSGFTPPPPLNPRR